MKIPFVEIVVVVAILCIFWGGVVHPASKITLKKEKPIPSVINSEKEDITNITNVVTIVTSDGIKICQAPRSKYKLEKMFEINNIEYYRFEDNYHVFITAVNKRSHLPTPSIVKVY